MTAEFAPKSAETLQSEIIADLGIEYEGNEEVVDKLVTRGLKDEEFKASLHADKKKHLEGKEALKQKMIEAGLDPETGKKLPKETGTEEKTSKNEMSLKDIRALQDVSDDDVDDVIEWARFKNVPIAEAKNSPHIKNLLKTKAEERASATAANTGPTKRIAKTDDSALLEKASKQDENMTDDDFRQAALARLNQKIAK